MISVSGNDLSGSNRTSLGSWAPLHGGCCPGIGNKTHVEEPKAGLSAGLGSEGTAGRKQGQEEATAKSRAGPDGGADSPQSQS